MFSSLTAIDRLPEEFLQAYVLVIPILAAGIGFGRCGVARIIRERAGRVLLDLGRSRWRKIGNILMYLFLSFLLGVNLLLVYDDGDCGLPDRSDGVGVVHDIAVASKSSGPETWKSRSR